MFLATVGEESVYTFTVTSDSDNINVMVLQNEGEDMLPDGVALSNDISVYNITWTADNSTVLNLTIVATDPSNQNVSSMFTPTIQLCACQNGGNCTTDGLLNTDLTFVVLNCNCPAGMCRIILCVLLEVCILGTYQVVFSSVANVGTFHTIQAVTDI